MVDVDGFFILVLKEKEMFAAASYVRFLCQDSKVMDVPPM